MPSRSYDRLEGIQMYRKLVPTYLAIELAMCTIEIQRRTPEYLSANMLVPSPKDI